MDILDIINKCENISYEYEQAESSAISYENEYESLRNCGWDDQDSLTHSVGLNALHYNNEMSRLEKEMDKYTEMLYGEKLAQLLVSEFEKIEITAFIKKISDFYNRYCDNTHIYTTPLFFFHDDELQLWDDMIEYNYINEFKWNINQQSYIIIINDNKEVNEYTQKEFFDWLKKDLSDWDLYDGEVTEELEMLIRIFKPNYYYYSF